MASLGTGNPRDAGPRRGAAVSGVMRVSGLRALKPRPHSQPQSNPHLMHTQPLNMAQALQASVSPTPLPDAESAFEAVAGSPADHHLPVPATRLTHAIHPQPRSGSPTDPPGQFPEQLPGSRQLPDPVPGTPRPLPRLYTPLNDSSPPRNDPRPPFQDPGLSQDAVQDSAGSGQEQELSPTCPKTSAEGHARCTNRFEAHPEEQSQKSSNSGEIQPGHVDSAARSQDSEAQNAEKDGHAREAAVGGVATENAVDQDEIGGNRRISAGPASHAASDVNAEELVAGTSSQHAPREGVPSQEARGSDAPAAMDGTLGVDDSVRRGNLGAGHSAAVLRAWKTDMPAGQQVPLREEPDVWGRRGELQGQRSPGPDHPSQSSQAMAPPEFAEGRGHRTMERPVQDGRQGAGAASNIGHSQAFPPKQVCCRSTAHALFVSSQRATHPNSLAKAAMALAWAHQRFGQEACILMCIAELPLEYSAARADSQKGFWQSVGRLARALLSALADKAAGRG